MIVLISTTENNGYTTVTHTESSLEEDAFASAVDCMNDVILRLGFRPSPRVKYFKDTLPGTSNSGTSVRIAALNHAILIEHDGKNYVYPYTKVATALRIAAALLKMPVIIDEGE